MQSYEKYNFFFFKNSYVKYPVYIDCEFLYYFKEFEYQENFCIFIILSVPLIGINIVVIGLKLVFG